MLQIGPGSVRYSTLCILRYRLLLADTLSRIRCAAFGAHVAALRGSHALQFSRINHTYAISHRIPDRALSSSIALRLRWSKNLHRLRGSSLLCCPKSFRINLRAPVAQPAVPHISHLCAALQHSALMSSQKRIIDFEADFQPLMKSWTR